MKSQSGSLKTGSFDNRPIRNKLDHVVEVVNEHSEFSKKPVALSRTPLIVGLLNCRSMRNKIIFIAETLKEFNLDILCITETWLFSSDVGIAMAALPDSYTLLHIPRSTGMRGGGVGLIYSLALSNLKLITNSNIEASSFEFMEVTFNLGLQAFRLAIVYRPGHPGTDPVFMEEFGLFLEVLLSRSERLIVCGDFNYWLDDPSSKPYTNEFLDLLDLNNMSNSVSVPTHLSGHTLDLVLTTANSDCVSLVEAVPIDSSISDHALVTFVLGVARPPTYSKSITFRSYCTLNLVEVGNIIESDLNSTTAPAQAADQWIESYNEIFSY